MSGVVENDVGASRDDTGGIESKPPDTIEQTTDHSTSETQAQKSEKSNLSKESSQIVPPNRKPSDIDNNVNKEVTFKTTIVKKFSDNINPKSKIPLLGKSNLLLKKRKYVPNLSTAKEHHSTSTTPQINVGSLTSNPSFIVSTESASNNIQHPSKTDNNFTDEPDQNPKEPKGNLIFETEKESRSETIDYPCVVGIEVTSNDEVTISFEGDAITTDETDHYCGELDNSIIENDSITKFQEKSYTNAKRRTPLRNMDLNNLDESLPLSKSAFEVDSVDNIPAEIEKHLSPKLKIPSEIESNSLLKSRRFAPRMDTPRKQHYSSDQPKRNYLLTNVDINSDQSNHSSSISCTVTSSNNAVLSSYRENNIITAETSHYSKESDNFKENVNTETGFKKKMRETKTNKKPKVLSSLEKNRKESTPKPSVGRKRHCDSKTFPVSSSLKDDYGSCICPVKNCPLRNPVIQTDSPTLPAKSKLLVQSDIECTSKANEISSTRETQKINPVKMFGYDRLKMPLKELINSETQSNPMPDIVQSETETTRQTKRVPQLKVINGKIELDESIDVEMSDDETSVDEEQFPKMRRNKYKKNRLYRRNRWNVEETISFYKTLNEHGSDFTIFEQCFENRTRRDCKLKFKREEKLRLGWVDEAMTCKAGKLDVNLLRKDLTRKSAERQRIQEERVKKREEKILLREKKKAEKLQEKIRARRLRALEKKKNKCAKKKNENLDVPGRYFFTTLFDRDSDSDRIDYKKLFEDDDWPTGSRKQRTTATREQLRSMNRVKKLLKKHTIQEILTQDLKILNEELDEYWRRKANERNQNNNEQRDKFEIVDESDEDVNEVELFKF